MGTASAKNSSIRVEWLRRSRRTSSEQWETPRWQSTPRPESIQHVAFHIALWSLFHRFFSFCRSPRLNHHSGVVANCDHTSEWVCWVRGCIGIAMRWMIQQKSLLIFLLIAHKSQFSLYFLDGIAWQWVTPRKSLIAFLLPARKMQFSLN